jgi:hypothetical protein
VTAIIIPTVVTRDRARAGLAADDHVVRSRNDNDPPGEQFRDVEGARPGILRHRRRTIETAGEDRRCAGPAIDPDQVAGLGEQDWAGRMRVSADLLTFASTEIPGGYHIATASRTGADLEIWPERRIGGFLRLSPEGGRLARTLLDPVRANNDIWYKRSRSRHVGAGHHVP